MIATAKPPPRAARRRWEPGDAARHRGRRVVVCLVDDDDGRDPEGLAWVKGTLPSGETFAYPAPIEDLRRPRRTR